MVVAICDKSALFREALAVVVTSSGHEVVCCVSTLADAIRSIERCQPDVMLLDASLTDSDSLAQWRARRKRGCVPRVLLLTGSGENGWAAAAVEAGLAEGVFDQAVALVTLERAVRGRSGPLSRARRTVTQPPRADSLLTAREYDVIGLLLVGRATVSIASTLGVSRSTVHSHVQSILRKLGARNRIEAVNIYLGEMSRKPDLVPWS
jgi:DNA-binding NarL/FixJ family response regulator